VRTTTKDARRRLKNEPLMLDAEPEQAEQSRRLSARTRGPMQADLRDGLDHVLQKHGPTS
jgi:hypothetical protein